MCNFILQDVVFSKNIEKKDKQNVTIYPLASYLYRVFKWNLLISRQGCTNMSTFTKIIVD